MMCQYTGTEIFTRVSSEAKRAFGVNPFLLSIISVDHTFPLTSPTGKTEGAVLVRHRSRRVVKVKLFLQCRKQAVSIFISQEY